MAELFNPNEFRQQIAAQTQGGHSGGPGSQNPVYAPQQTVPAPVPAPVPPRQPQNPAPAPAQYHGAPQQAGQAQPYVHQAPQAPMNTPQQPYAPPPSQPAHPAQMHPQQGIPQQGYQQQGYKQHQQGFNPQQQFEMPQKAQEPAKKGGLFKRKKLKTAMDKMTPSPNGMPNVMGQNGMLQNALPVAPKAGLSRPIVFAGGLALGVLGTLIGILLFSPTEPQRASIVANPAAVVDGSQSALTDKMLLEGKKPG